MAASSGCRLVIPVVARVRGSAALCTQTARHAELAETQPPPRSLYPPVVASLTARSKASSQRRYAEERRLVHETDSVTEKIRLLTKLQRRKYVIYPQTFALNADRWYQHFTKTAMLPGLPAGAAPDTPGLELEDLRSLVCDALLQETFYMKKRRPVLHQLQEHSAEPFLTGLVSVLRAELARHNPLLAASHLDLKPNVNFYWMRGETVVPRGHRRGKVDPIRFQIDDIPHSQIRVPQQLPPFVPLEHSVTEDIPVITVGPDKLPLFKRQYDNNIFIGSKVDDPCCYGHTQFHLQSERMMQDKLLGTHLADQIEVRLRAHAIASLFAWTGAQAMYQGFWSHSDLTRPFVSQSVISDGKYFSFYCYQLNTLALTVETDQNNTRKNVCWGTESAPLYEAVEGSDIKGFNNEVLKMLVQFLLYRP
ncbi:large ribosomal subunit protein mL65 [Ambystoma mexicanum]|uniref:large ribosomal subunit protein mL65 n=1 Tax=Ambystoma mexicanum TaxID=8296 RepID=UPI0037E9B12F